MTSNKIAAMKKITKYSLFMLALLMLNKDMNAQKINSFTAQHPVC